MRRAALSPAGLVSPHTLSWIGIGSNRGRALSLCRRAVARLRGHPCLRVVVLSPWYRTEPVGPVRQSWYINGVVGVESRLGPQALLRLLHRVEARFGRNRRREKRWGPRRLDLDLLFCGDRVVRCRLLQLPHPRLHQRRFVLRPLADIAPDFVHPRFGKTVDTLLQEVDDTARVERLPQCGTDFRQESGDLVAHCDGTRFPRLPVLASRIGLTIAWIDP
ncbi:MAG: 2-amino-4-hydroxy-6-hydroxymethyldihydropteridine diphosphokinase [Magnetococcales bacterium]|nr:2-amino-4-hydroxy-6-hydroxymethyldihydropteridine diphosphokinase [Magnetococcales bacterium]